MVDLAEIQAAYYMVAATGVLIAAVYYVLNIQNNRKNQELMLKAQQNTLETREAQLLWSLYQRWSDTEIQDAWRNIASVEYNGYDDYMAKYGMVTNPEFERKRAIVGSFFEGLGVFVKRGFIEAAMVDDLMSMYIITYWQKIGPILIEVRRRLNSPTSGEYTEYLYNVIYEIWRQQHPETPEPFRPATSTQVNNKVND